MAFNIKEHLIERHVDFSAYSVWCDHENDLAYFPLWSLNGQMVGYQKYSPMQPKKKRNAGKYFTHATYSQEVGQRKIGHAVPVWGLESIKDHHKVLYVTEGIFDAVRLINNGAAAIALLGKGDNSSIKNYLSILKGSRRLVCVLDPDQKKPPVSTEFHRVNVPGAPTADLADAPQEYINENILEKYGT